MPFNILTGVYTPVSGAVTAAPGAVIQSAVWNNINGDVATALTELGKTSPMGLIPRTLVKYATTGVLPNSPTYSNGASGVGATLTAGSNGAISIDGATPSVADRVLVKNQTTAFQNGVYAITTVGDSGTPYVLTRVTDFDTSGEMLLGSYFLVSSGTANQNSSYVLLATVTTVGTSDVIFGFANQSVGITTVPVLPISGGGTNATTAAGARTNLGLGTIATQNSSAVAITGGTITGMPNPSTFSDVANKAYVDATATGLHVLTPARLGTAAILPNSPTYSNGASGVGATLTAGSSAALVVDGVTPSTSDRILVKNQGSAFQNGVYTVTTVGSGAAAWVLTRATDFDQAAEMIAGSYILVTAGSTNAGAAFVLQATVTTVGTDPVTWVVFSNVSVSSFNSRVGAVLPAAGDYTLGQIALTTANRIPFTDGTGLLGTSSALTFDGSIQRISATNTQIQINRAANTAGNYALLNFFTGGSGKYIIGLDADDDGVNVDKLGIYDIAASPTLPSMAFTGGNVGIGTFTPNPIGASVYGRTLTITNTVATNRAVLQLWTNATPSATNGGIAGQIDFINGSSPTLQAATILSQYNGTTSGTGNLVFFTSATAAGLGERMRISPAGNIGIGSTAPNVLLTVGTEQVTTSLSPLSTFLTSGNKPVVVGDGNNGIMLGYGGNDIQGRTGTTYGANGNLNLNPYGGNIVTPAQIVGTSLASGTPLPYVSVKAWGVVGDGSTNDSAAFQSAIDAMAANSGGGGVILVPPGSYYIPDGITLKEGVQIWGSGHQQGSALFTNLDTTTLIKFDSTCFYAGLFNLGIFNQVPHPTNNVVHVFGLGNVIRDCNIGGGHAALFMEGTDCLVENCVIQGYDYMLFSTSANWYIRCKFDQGDGSYTATAGYRQDASVANAVQENHFFQCDFTGFYTHAIEINDTAFGQALTVFEGCVFSQPSTIDHAVWTCFSACEVGGNIALNASNGGKLTVIGSYGFSGVSITGGSSQIVNTGNFNIT